MTADSVRHAFSRYTNRARHAVALGREAALAANHAYVGTEHLLLGILAEGGDLAVKILQTLEVDPRDVEAEIRGYIRPGDKNPDDTPISSNTRRALELAAEEAPDCSTTTSDVSTCSSN